jgi:hypothetical protein
MGSPRSQLERLLLAPLNKFVELLVRPVLGDRCDSEKSVLVPLPLWGGRTLNSRRTDDRGEVIVIYALLQICRRVDHGPDVVLRFFPGRGRHKLRVRLC